MGRIGVTCQEPEVSAGFSIDQALLFLCYTAGSSLIILSPDYLRGKFYPDLCSNRGFPGGTSGKESACHCRRPKSLGSVPGLRRWPGAGNGNLL